MTDFPTSFFSWINDHLSDNPADLRLRFAGKPGPAEVDIPFAILQVECRRKCARKLADTLASFPRFVFPTALSAEQCSSDRLASFHASLVPEGACTGVDLTAGLGIDAMTLGRRGLAMTAVEQAHELAKALRYNSRGLGVEDFEVVEGDCREWLSRAVAEGRRYDVAFIDPARRSESGGRLFALEACSPDVLAMLPDLAKVCGRLIVKASPMLDVIHTAAELTPPGATELIAAGTTTECKELIAVVDFPSAGTALRIRSVTLLPDGTASEYSYTVADEREAPSVAAGPGIAPGMVLCEPYPSTMKCGAHRALAAAFGLYGFDANTRLYYATEAPDGFPGESFDVVDVQEYASKNIKRFARKYPAISVTARNFGLTAEELRRKLAVRDGDGRLRVFGLTAADGRRLLIVGQNASKKSGTTAI
ncbi:MAG: RsmD family RNA methyltransferase [Muribaculaceae bacterium]|nr:RsmD family RNA methyltransferase [Muribaculaceae bacterium]